MKTIESFIQGKRIDQSNCEDGLYIGDNLVVVIDGVTTKGNRLVNGLTSGVFAKNTIVQFLNENDNLYKLSAIDFLFSLHTALSEAVIKLNESVAYEYYPRANVIVYNGYYQEVWSYGDCQGIVDGRVLDFSKEIDYINSTFRALHIENALLNGMTIEDIQENDIGRKAIEHALIMQYDFENKDCPFGYPVLNGLSFNEKMIKSIQVPVGTEVILASDGYPNLKPTLEESEKSLEEVIKTDPLCFRQYKSTKGISKGNISYDDRTYWRGIYLNK